MSRGYTRAKKERRAANVRRVKISNVEPRVFDCRFKAHPQAQECGARSITMDIAREHAKSAGHGP